MSDSLPPCGLEHTRPHFPTPTPGAYSDSCPLGQWCPLAISPSVVPFSSCQHQGLFQWVSSSHQVAKVLEAQLQPKTATAPRVYHGYAILVLCLLTKSYLSPINFKESFGTRYKLSRLKHVKATFASYLIESQGNWTSRDFFDFVFLGFGAFLFFVLIIRFYWYKQGSWQWKTISRQLERHIF